MKSRNYVANRELRSRLPPDETKDTTSSRDEMESGFLSSGIRKSIRLTFSFQRIANFYTSRHRQFFMNPTVTPKHASDIIFGSAQSKIVGQLRSTVCPKVGFEGPPDPSGPQSCRRQGDSQNLTNVMKGEKRGRG